MKSVAWQEYQSEHFILDTDVSEEDAAAIMATFEALRAADLTLLAGAGADFAGHIRLFIPAQLELYNQIAPRYAAAYYTHDLYFSIPIIVAPASLCLRSPQVVAHELAHAVSRYLYPQQRPWFSEGLAQFAETVGRQLVQGQGQSAKVKGSAGEVGGRLAEFVHGHLQEPASHLLVAKSSGGEDPKDVYESGWLLYSWLWHFRGKELSDFQRRLAGGDGWDAAWSASFPGFDPANAARMSVLDDWLAEYRAKGRFPTFEVSAEERFTIQKRPFPAMRYWLTTVRRDWPKDDAARALRERQELERARADDPANPDVLIELARLEKKLDLPAARAIAAGAPGQFRGWLSLAMLAQDPAEEEGALRKAVAAGPECAVCHNNLAWFLSLHGRAAEGRPFAERAVDLAPWDVSYVDTLADTASRLGQCKQALQLEERAVRMAEFAGMERDAYRARLEGIQERCAAR